MQTPEPLARLRGVRKRYGALTALDGIDIDVQRGEVLALLGANGAGKSTAINLLLGLLEADDGEARLFGASPQALSARRRIGVMLQSAGLPDHATVAELIELTRSYYPAPRSTADCIALAGLDGLLHRRYAQLSGGQQRRVQFALALCGRPELLFLDEPTTGLDIEARQALWRAIRELVAGGCAVLLTTHYLEEAEALANRVVMLARGRVVAAGRMDEVRAQIVRARIRVTTALDPAHVAAWPQVHEVTCAGSKLELVVGDADAIVRRLLAGDSACRDLEVQRAGLADAFVELTRDAAPAAHKETA
jgi:ABC-2 type transport system ATP-binding protein